MAERKNLVSLALAGALALGGAGCGYKHPEYNFKGKIGEEQVSFYMSDSLFNDCYLEVIKADSTKIYFIDYACESSPKVDCLVITIGENTTEYCTPSSNDAVKKVLEEAQKQFDSYLEKIMEIQTAPLKKKE